jgi:uncharacterized cupin superfamily protein
VLEHTHKPGEKGGDKLAISGVAEELSERTAVLQVGCDLRGVFGRCCMRIKVEKPSAETVAEMKSCPTWSKEASIFDWEYDATETCYVMEGEVKVTTPDGEAVEFGPGDLVTFPRGLKCSWNVRTPIRKHYRFS